MSDDIGPGPAPKVAHRGKFVSNEMFVWMERRIADAERAEGLLDRTLRTLEAMHSASPLQAEIRAFLAALDGTKPKEPVFVGQSVDPVRHHALVKLTADLFSDYLLGDAPDNDTVIASERVVDQLLALLGVQVKALEVWMREEADG